MNISLIAALAHHRVIGNENRLPWYLPADLKHFKQLTLHKKIIMGRKTYESIGHSLTDRHNIILTTQTNFKAPNCQVIHDYSALLPILNSNEEIIVIGGAEIFKFFLPLADHLYLTLIDADIPGDTHFPAWNQDEWEEINREYHAKDEKNFYNYTFITLCRRN